MTTPLKELEARAWMGHFRLEPCAAHPPICDLNSIIGVHLAELSHFRSLTGMDALELEKTLDEATGLQDWTGLPDGAMFRALLPKQEEATCDACGGHLDPDIDLHDQDYGGGIHMRCR